MANPFNISNSGLFYGMLHPLLNTTIAGKKRKKRKKKIVWHQGDADSGPTFAKPGILDLDLIATSSSAVARRHTAPHACLVLPHAG